MSIIAKLKALIGLEEQRRGDAGHDIPVTVEDGPDASTERAVKEPASESAGAAAGGEGAAEDDAATGAGGASVADGTDAGTGSDGEATAASEESTGGDAASSDSAAAEPTPVDEIKGVGPTYAERLSRAGVDSVADLATVDPAELAEAADVAETRVENWVEQARARQG